MEIWKPIKNYEELYEVSNYGNIISKKRGKIKKPFYHNGYLRVELSKSGVNKKYFVHRLVAETFIENSENLEQVNHKDENKLNNYVGNLEWCSTKYNINFGTRSKRVSKALTNRTDLSKKIVQLNKAGDVINTYNSMHEAERIGGFSISKISQCCNGKRKTHSGFIWRFKNNI